MIDSAAARAHLDGLAKPRGSLGRIEDLAVRLAMIQQRLDPVARPRRAVLFAADHGVVAQGVSAWPSDVTALMVATILSGRATSNALAAAHGCDLRVIDVGVATPSLGPCPSFFRDASLGPGTADLSLGPALTPAQFDAAWAIGVDEATAARALGFEILIAGEMGIGNTTPAACLTALLAGVPIALAAGPGAGADQATIAIKRRVVAHAVARARSTRAQNLRASIATVAGFELAAMAGFFAAGAAAGATLLLDGYVATAAALIAERLAPGTAAGMIAAHRSAEPGHAMALAALDLTPLLDFDMRLGEGTGALVALPLLDCAAALMRNVAALADIGVGRAD